jgi:predicted DNA-binding transcriptional regulator YafY
MSQTERIIWINERLESGNDVTSSDIAKKFEISTRQAKRDIEYMRERLDAEIEFSATRKAYCYRPGFRLSYSHTNEKMLLLNAVVRNFSKHTGLMPLATDLLQQSFENGMGKDSLLISDKIVFLSPIIDLPDQTIFSKVIEAMEKNKRIAMEYQSITGDITRRHVEPIKLVSVSSTWYLIAYDTQKQALRNFHLARIHHLSVLDEQNAHTVTEEFLQEYMSSGFGVYMEKKPVMVTIRFTGLAINEISTQVWHKEQSIIKNKDELLLSLPVSSLNEVLHKILSFGKLAEPLEPAELVRLWKEEIQAMEKIASQ